MIVGIAKIKLNKQESCQLCGPRPEKTELLDAEQAVCYLH